MGKSSDRPTPDKLPAKDKMAYTEAAIAEIAEEQVEIYSLTHAQLVHVLAKITAFWASNAVAKSPRKKRK